MLRREFVEAIMDEVRMLLPEENVEFQEVIKNNGVVLNGVLIRKQNENIVPTIYIDTFVRDGERDDNINVIKRIAAEIVNTYKNKVATPPRFVNIRDMVLDFEKVAPMLRIRLVNKENNAKLFETVPYIPFLDMAMIAVIELENDGEGCASIKVTHDLIRAWGYISLSDIFPTAKANTFSKSYKLQSMAEILADMSGMPKEFFDNTPIKMYVLTNDTNINGATEICNYSAMESIADKFGTDLIVLPSSIHEVIIVPKKGDKSLEDFTQMVRDINGSEVAADEILSDHAYVFTREDGWDF